MRLKSALRRGVAAAVIAGIVVSSGIPAYADRWDIVKGDIIVEAGSAKGTNKVTQGETTKEDTDTVITGKSKEHTITIDTSKGNVDVTFDDLKIDVSGKAEVDGSGKAEVDGGGDSPVRESNAAVTVKGDHDATIELDGKNELKSGSKNAGLEKNDERSEDGKTISGKLAIKDDKGKDGSLTAAGGAGGGACPKGCSTCNTHETATPDKHPPYAPLPAPLAHSIGTHGMVEVRRPAARHDLRRKTARAAAVRAHRGHRRRRYGFRPRRTHRLVHRRNPCAVVRNADSPGVGHPARTLGCPGIIPPADRRFGHPVRLRTRREPDLCSLHALRRAGLGFRLLEPPRTARFCTGVLAGGRGACFE